MTPDHMTLLGISEDDVGLAANPGQPVWQFLCNAIADVDVGALQGIALSGTTDGNGHWEYSVDGGTSWSSVGARHAGAALLLSADDYMRFVPDGRNGTTATLTYHAWDQTTGTHGTSVDLTAAGATGGTTAYSTLTDTVSIAVSDVNDAPQVGAAVVLPSLAEDSGTRLITQALLLGNTTDVDGGAQLTAADLELVGAGTLTDNLDGTWTYAPAPDDDTAVSFTYTVTDGLSAPVATTATLDFTPVNDAPQAHSGVAGGDEDAAVAGTVTASDVDNADDALTFALVGANGGALHGTVTLDAATGAYVYTPDRDFFGADSFSFTASDGVAVSAAAIVSISVDPVNDAPAVTTASPLSVAENRIVVAALGAIDIDGLNPVSFAVAGGADASLFEIVAGNLAFRAARDYETDARSYQVRIAAFDGVDTSTRTLTVDLTDVNDNAPVFVSDPSAPSLVPENTAQAVYAAAATDADGATGSTVAYSLSGDDAACFVIDPSSGIVRFATAPDYEAPQDQDHDNVYRLIVHASDGLHDTTQDVTVTVTAVNDAPVAAHGAAAGEQAIAGQLVASDADSPALTYWLVSGPAHGKLSLKPDGTFSYAADLGYRGADSFTFKANDGALDSNVATFGLDVTQLRLEGGAGDEGFTAVAGNQRIDAGGGTDTITFDFRLTDATFTWAGNRVIVDTASSHTVLTGVEVFNFADGTVNNNDADVRVDDLYYYASYHDVWNAHVDADAHYHDTGWREWRDPSAFFSTSFYLAVNADVKASGADPLVQFGQAGWAQGRQPSMAFDANAYLKANLEVAAAYVDALAHFLASGAGEGRQPVALTALIAANGFDYVYYLGNNPDVAAAHIDPYLHFQTIGWTEGRNPNASFDTAGYLATYADVAAALVNPLDHYNQFGWREGRAPSVGFDTTSYLAAYPDVSGAGVNPLVHFLEFGVHESRSAFADGVWG